MKISTRGRYALRLMVDIATNEGENEFVRIKEISKRQGISEKYLEQIISALKKAGYVKSLRGAQGGYRLSKRPEEYTAGGILRLTEGDMSPVACLEGGEKGCMKAEACITLPLWNMIDKAVSEVIDKVTLEDLINWQNGDIPEI